MVDVYTNDIRNALKNKCYFSALALSLALPDICGSVEFPNESVYERYVGWYDKYVGDSNIGNAPCLSGELVYNLRNTFLHQGWPTVLADKVKEEANQLDGFMLVLGDGRKIWSFSCSVQVGPVNYRKIMIDVTYLCETLCDCADVYYKQNEDRFEYRGIVVADEYIFGDAKIPEEYVHGDISDVLGKKLEDATGMKVDMKNLIDRTFMRMREELARQLLWLRDVRNYVEKNVTEEEYDKEYIIQALTEANTKTQLNAFLTKKYPGSDVKVILKRIKPLVKNLPGR